MEIKNNDYLRVMAVGKRRGSSDLYLLEKANEFAMKIHKNEFRKNGEPFIVHPWATARIITDMGLDTNLIAAALLHDVLEHSDCLEDLEKTFSPVIINLVKVLTRPSVVEGGKQYGIIQYREYFQEVLQQYPEALYIIIAGRIHNLRTPYTHSKESFSAKVLETKEFHLELAERMHLQYMSYLLKDACFGAEQTKLRNQFHLYYRDLLDANKWSLKYTKNLLDAIFNKRQIKDLALLQKMQYIHSFFFKQPLPWQLFNSIIPHIEYKEELQSRLNKHTAALYHFYLVTIQECPQMPVDFFMDYYYQILVPERIIIVDMQHDEFGHFYFVLEDKYENRFYLYLMTQREYEEYTYGIISGKVSGAYNSDKNYVKNSEIAIPNMNVYTPKGDCRKIPRGATALDFAFRIHDNIGLCAKSCIINGIESPISTVLNEYDKVEITVNKDCNGEPVPCPKLQWFEIVRTPLAVYKLVEWFQRRFAAE